jgi:hypothetical protein
MRDKLIDLITIGIARARVKEANGTNVDQAAEIADVLLENNYRNATDVAEDIFDDLSKFIVTKVIIDTDIVYDINDKYIEVQKKYGVRDIIFKKAKERMSTFKKKYVEYVQ